MNINQFNAFVKGKNIVMLGVGISNNGVSRLLKSKGADVTVCDRQTRNKLGAVCNEIESLGVKLYLGENYLDALTNADIIFRTPGFYYNSPAISKARAMGKTVTSEIEVFFDLCPCPIYAVTGSDGKTTTSTLIANFFSAQGKTVHLGGNIGRALLPRIESIREEDVAVVELSSFQLISMRTSPDVAVVTNISPNHLDVHQNMDEYISAKYNILAHQNAFTKAVLNQDNDLTRSMSGLVRGRLSTFSLKHIPVRGAYLDKNGYLCMSENGSVNRLFHKDEIFMPGLHNVENYLAAITAVHPFVGIQNIRKVAASFKGVEHRIEFVAEHRGVKWYNDSKATNPTSTIACLNSFNKKIILIAGGYDKKAPYEPMAPVLAKKAKALILMGDTACAIEAAVRPCSEYREGILPVIHAISMEEAVQSARRIAADGDIVVLSPASASFDKYKNFEQRGEHFKSIVNNLQ